MRQTLVETRIECEATECAAISVRPSTVDHRSSNFTTFDATSALVLDVITAASTTPANQPMWGSSSSEMFINNSNAIPTANGLSWGLADKPGVDVDLTTVSPQFFAGRASILLNTGVQAFLAPTGFAGGLPTNLSLYGPGHIPAYGLSLALQEVQQTPRSYDDASAFVTNILNQNTPFFGASTNATVIQYAAVYQPVLPWVILLAVSSCFLLITGLIGICLGFRTAAPDVFDPVISLTYDNPYISLCNARGPLEAGDRGRLLRNLRLRLGDGSIEATIGKVVFGEVTQVEAFDKDRLYY